MPPQPYFPSNRLLVLQSRLRMKGLICPPEHSTFSDPDTGARVHQVTSHPSINHPTYYLQSSFFPDGRWLVFTSYRPGSPQLFQAAFPEGPIRQLTDGDAIHPFSPAIHPSGERVFFVRGGSIWSIETAGLEERLVISVEGAQLGECSLDDKGQGSTASNQQGGGHRLVT